MIVQADGTLDPTWGAKVYLVPFTEALPFRGLLGSLLEDRGGEWRWVTGGFAAAESGTVMHVGTDPVGVLICFEQLFSNLTSAMRNNGAQLR
jgi:apolipoprotein N-acyltransferase